MYFSESWTLVFFFWVAHVNIISYGHVFHVFEGKKMCVVLKDEVQQLWNLCMSNSTPKNVPSPNGAHHPKYSHLYKFNFNIYSHICIKLINFQFFPIWNIQYIHQITKLASVDCLLSFDPVINPVINLVIRNLPTGSWFFLIF